MLHFVQHDMACAVRYDDTTIRHYFVGGSSSFETGLIRVPLATRVPPLSPMSWPLMEVSTYRQLKLAVPLEVFDGSARLWDAASGQELRPFLGHTGAVYAVAFSPDGRYLLTGADDQTARVWDVQTGVEVRRLTTQATEVRDVDFSPDGKYILMAGGDSTARLWPTDYHDTIRYLCGVLTRDLTPDERTLRHHRQSTDLPRSMTKPFSQGHVNVGTHRSALRA